jgi:hypothetical protein
VGKLLSQGQSSGFFRLRFGGQVNGHVFSHGLSHLLRSFRGGDLHLGDGATLHPAVSLIHAGGFATLPERGCLLCQICPHFVHIFPLFFLYYRRFDEFSVQVLNSPVLPKKSQLFSKKRLHFLKQSDKI